MHHFGEGFGEAVGEQLGHDGRVVVALGAELVAKLLQADSGREGEGADVVGRAVAPVGDEVGQAEVFGAARLVAKHGQRMAASLRIGEEDVVPAADGGVDSHDALQREEPFVGDAVQQRLCVVEEFAGFVAPFGVVEEVGAASFEPPCGEEEVPVDEGFDVGDVEVGEDEPSRVGCVI